MYPIYCINLKNRKDRKQLAMNEFSKLGILSNRVIFPHFTKDHRGGVYGCFNSHMKIWDDFFTKYPDKKYCLIFEDDFCITKNTKSIIKKATRFIDKNYKDIDLLFLHNLRINTDNKINNNLFTNGFGLTTHSYFITRHYIQSKINQYGKIPEENGRHFDYELNFNKYYPNNLIYSEKIFFTNKECIKQQEYISSDNSIVLFNKMPIYKNVNKRIEHCKLITLFVRDNFHLSNDQLKKISFFISKVILHNSNT